MVWLCVAIALAVVGVPFAGASASIVTNGSFEETAAGPGKVNSGQTFDNLLSGPGASWQIWDSLPGWTTASGGGIEVQSNRTLSSIDALDGGHYVELDSTSNSSMFQDVVLGLGAHELSFGYSPRTHDAASMGITYSLGSLANGAVYGHSSRADVGAWTIVSQVFDVTRAGSYRLMFGATGASDSYGGLIDRVAITTLGRSLESPSEIPVPSSMALLVGAGMALGALRLRRSS